MSQEFVGCRGFIGVRLLRSDNRSNFVLVSGELFKALTEMNQKINQFTQDDGGELISYKKNELATSNIGGVWEMKTITAREILESLLKTHRASLSEESLCPLMVEIAAIWKSYLTLAYVMSTVSFQLLQWKSMKSKVVTMKLKDVMLLPGVFSRTGT